MVLAFLSVAVGLILDTETRGRREMKLLANLSPRGLGEYQNAGTHLVSGRVVATGKNDSCIRLVDLMRFQVDCR
jgi:hypothetical protein